GGLEIGFRAVHIGILAGGSLRDPNRRIGAQLVLLLEPGDALLLAGRPGCFHQREPRGERPPGPLLEAFPPICHKRNTGMHAVNGSDLGHSARQYSKTTGKLKHAPPMLYEVVFHLFEQAFFRRCVVHRQTVAQQFEQAALVAVQARGNSDVDVDDQVAAGAAVQNRDALMTQLEFRAALGTFRNLQPMRAFEGGYVYFAAQRGLRHVERNRAVQIVFVAFEESVLAHLEEHVQIARRTALRAGLAFAGQAQPRAIVHAGGNVDLQFALPLPVALAAALAAGVANDLAGAAASGTGAANAEEALLVEHLAAAVAGGAGGRPAAGLRARSMAPAAGLHPRHLDIGAHAEQRLFERNFQIVAHVLAALRARPPAASARAKHVAEAEEVAQDVAEIGKRVGIETAAARALHAGVAVTVVRGALLRVAQNA